MNLQEADREAATVAKAPRVSLADIEAAIACRYDTTGDRAILGGRATGDPTHHDALERLSICILVMRNGFTVIGKSAPASAENFNAELGRKFAYQDAVRQLWPLMDFALRDRLAKEGK
jgi:Phage protein (N4 Gp49/phage Sf6 gene 66) family